MHAVDLKVERCTRTTIEGRRLVEKDPVPAAAFTAERVADHHPEPRPGTYRATHPEWELTFTVEGRTVKGLTAARTSGNAYNYTLNFGDARIDETCTFAIVSQEIPVDGPRRGVMDGVMSGSCNADGSWDLESTLRSAGNPMRTGHIFHATASG